MIGRNVVFDDGLFEVTLIKTPKNPLELQEIIAALLIEQIDTKYMYTFRTGEVEFESLEEIPWTLDGEYGGSHDQVTVRNYKQELSIMVPKKHIASLDDVKEEDRELMGHIMFKIHEIATDLELENGYRVVSNNGEDAFQTVKHLHFHILGKRKLTWPPG